MEKRENADQILTNTKKLPATASHGDLQSRFLVLEAVLSWIRSWRGASLVRREIVPGCRVEIARRFTAGWTTIESAMFTIDSIAQVLGQQSEGSK
jgi:hypothetical protein